MIIGLTGGSGTGKSIALQIFKAIGYATYSSDEAAKRMYADPKIKEKIIQLLGRSAYNGNEINKVFIRKHIFDDASLRASVNAIIHPAVTSDFMRFVQLHPGHILQESALLFETGIDKRCDKVIVITANEATRIRRLQKRDDLPASEILQRLNAQWPEAKKIEKADFVIYNNDHDHLLEQVLTISERIKDVHP
jgi:dephospho-CoA kinase